MANAAAAAAVNIAGLTPVPDPAYRYKRPALSLVARGRGNGQLTLVANAAAVADALGRPAAHLAAFWGAELGCAGRVVDDGAAVELRGAHDAPRLDAALRRYVEGFVLCPRCRLPETALVMRRATSGGLQVRHRCAACGAASPLPAAAAAHKLTAAVLAQATAALAPLAPLAPP
jgi:translation initiation factor 5